MNAGPSFVFQGTVVRVGEANVALVEADDKTAVVRVDRILRAPEQMEQIAGREITVQLRQTADPGTSAVFETEGWLYGASLAVVETGRRRAPETERRPTPAPEHAPETPAAADRAARFREALKSRADEASAVVVGRVTGVRRAETAAEGAAERRLSEHDPQWAVATVEVDEAVKGAESGTVEVLFASSEDVMWRDAPKLTVGQRAVILLQRGETAPGLESAQAPAVVDRLDVQPPDVAELVAELSGPERGRR